jgi:hypothetical protein
MSVISCTVCEKTVGNLITILGELVKSRSASICLDMSVRQLETNQKSMEELVYNLIFEYYSKVCREKSRCFKICQAYRLFYIKVYVYLS